jgi:hypothetical protein
MDPQLRSAAEAATLLVERQAGDPLYQWEPFGAQRRFLEFQGEEAWILAANRYGKSDPLAACVASTLRTGSLDPKPAYFGVGNAVYDRAVSVSVISPTFDMSRNIMQPKIFDNGTIPPGQSHAPFIPAYEVADWNKNEGLLKLRNGSLAFFRSSDQGPRTFEGFGRDVIAFDEAPPKAIYNAAVIRIEAGRKLLVRGVATLLPPDGVTGGISWLYTDKIKPWLQAGGTREQPPPSWDGKLLLLGGSIYDNPHLDQSEIQRLETTYPPGSVDRAIRLDGEWLPQIVGSRAYPPFDARIHVNPHLSRKVEYRLPLLYCHDSNVSPVVAVIMQQHGRLYRVLDEITIETGSLQDVAREFMRRFPNHGAELLMYGDEMATHRHVQTGGSDYDVLLGALRGLPYPLTLCVPTVNPTVGQRINAVNCMLRGPGGEVRLEVAPHCQEVIEDFETVQRSRDGGIMKVRNKADPYYRRTHWTDAIGYCLAAREPVAAFVDADPLRAGAVAAGYGMAGSRIPTPGYRFGEETERPLIVGGPWV